MSEERLSTERFLQLRYPKLLEQWPWVAENTTLFESFQVSVSVTTTGGVTDWNEVADSYSTSLKFPGVPKEQIKVELEGRDLQITVKQVEEGIPSGCHRALKFSGSTPLPEKAGADTVKATLDNGVLTITCYKERDTGSAKERAAGDASLRSVEIV